ncbi:MDR family MFS transporter [Methanocella arvoryzae]|uniref:Permease (Major facilitator superfamily) n=1 Tax=Methanocella arvoryzae (strain DSM 22066 / NBRC 105507 / MRE50) TaxID=351160 RepID=Q0W0H1_METAR|nr:MFS transporter [Methanocella arvoryzae]CAJ38122.1 putative permease (major facilitator superfamily) [Methanocella arvoryzae MRE50]
MIDGIFRRYDRQIWILTGGSLINSFGFSIAYPFISLYLYMYRGIPMTDVGMALLIAAAIGLLGQVAGGELCDRIGRKAVMSFGIALNVVAFGLLTTAILFQAGYPVFVVLLCLREIAGGLYKNVPSVMVSDVVPEGDRNGAFSLLRIGGNLGFAIGPIIGGILATYSYAYMFAVTMFTSAIFLLITIFLLRDTRPDQCGANFAINGAKVWSDHPFLWFCIVSAVISVVYSQMLSTFSTYSGSYGQINESMIGLLFSLNGFMIVFLQYPIAVFLERFRLTTALIVGSLLYAAGFGMVGFCTGFWPLFLCMLIISTGELVFSPPSMNIVSRMASPENRGRYMSISGVLGSAGFAAGPFIGGFLMDQFSGTISLMWLILGLLGVVCVLGFIVLRSMVSSEIDKAEGVPEVYPIQR